MQEMVLDPPRRTDDEAR